VPNRQSPPPHTTRPGFDSQVTTTPQGLVKESPFAYHSQYSVDCRRMMLTQPSAVNSSTPGPFPLQEVPGGMQGSLTGASGCPRSHVLALRVVAGGSPAAPRQRRGESDDPTRTDPTPSEWHGFHYSSEYFATPNVSHFLGSPLSKPWRNQRMR
jgi:hypothetical protein